MTDWIRRTALERRYDGPIPPMAAVSADFVLPWRRQVVDRRHWAWADVRRIGRLAVRSARALRDTGDPRHRRDWIRYRKELTFALRVWGAYRDWCQDQHDR